MLGSVNDDLEPMFLTFLYPSADGPRCYATRTYNECVTRTTFAFLVLLRSMAGWSGPSLVLGNRVVSWRLDIVVHMKTFSRLFTQSTKLIK